MSITGTIFDYVPGIRDGGGILHGVTLVGAGTLAVNNGYDYLVVPPCLLSTTTRNPSALTLACATVVVGNTGTGTGGTTVRLVKNGDTVNGVLFTTSIAAGASIPYVSLDVRTPSGSGIPLQVGDVLRLDVTSIPGTTASSNLIVHLTFEGYAIKA